MKILYWKSCLLPRMNMILLCLISLACLICVEYFKQEKQLDFYDKRMQATEKTEKALVLLKKIRAERKIPIDPELDPEKTGIVGEQQSPITSVHGSLKSKQLAVNPEMASLFVEWLEDLKLQNGDTVAIGMTGSFPALNVGMLAAVETLELKPLLICSGTSSQYGANIPGFSILDMLHELNKAGILSTPVIAAAIGGYDDSGKGLPAEGMDMVKKTIAKYGYQLIQEPNIPKAVKERIKVYADAAGSSNIKAYINVGGGAVSVGKNINQNATKNEKQYIREHPLKNGPLTNLPIQLYKNNAVAVEFLKKGIPVINMRRMDKIAFTYDLELWAPEDELGEGPFFYTLHYNIWLASAGLIIILGLCFLNVRMLRAKAAEEG